MAAPLQSTSVGRPAPERQPQLGGPAAVAAQPVPTGSARRAAASTAVRTAPSSSGNGGCSSGSRASVAPRQVSDSEQRRLTLLQRLGRGAAGLAAAAVLAAGGLAAPPPASALLANPRAPVPRSADVALRRSIPAFNPDVATVQEKLEAVGFKLRIPQRKPWGSMSDDVAAAAELAGDEARMLKGVLPPDEEQARQLVADIQQQLER